LFVPEIAQNKITKNLKKLANEGSDIKYKMRVMTADNKINEAMWSIHILHNKLNIAEEIVLALKKGQCHE
jgi:hypothetical protein